MPGARSVLPKHRKKVFKRGGSPSKAEKELVAQFVLDQPKEITPTQVNALARTMRRSKELVRQMIETAKENFQASAEHYVEVHKQAVDKALANGDAKSLAVAVEGSQWALENLTVDGVRLIDGKKQEQGSQAGKIMIGIQIGGIRQEDPAPAVAVVEAEKV